MRLCRKIAIRAKLGVRVCCFFLMRMISFLIFPKKRFADIWLFSERGADACDNAWVMFCYVRETEPCRRLYYILENNAPCRTMVASVGRTLRKGSFLHLLLYFLPTTKISTHILGTAPDPALFSSPIGKKLLRCAGKTIFLQHGITKNDVPALYARNTDVDLFVCGAEPEWRFVLSRFGYSEQKVRYLGLPRFDLLHTARVKRQILFFPTWRSHLSPCSASEFFKSDYARSIDSVLRDVCLHTLLAQYKTRFILVPHPEMRRFYERYSTESPYVLVDAGDIGAWVRECAAVITDESSVAFDFAYCRRPVIYAPLPGLDVPNYPDGWFVREIDGFGEVVRNTEELICAVRAILERDFQTDPRFEKRAAQTFPLCDEENRKRCHEAILQVAKCQKM